MAFNQDIKKQLKEQESTLQGSGAPTGVTPEFVGQHYINTDDNHVWVAKSLTTGDFVEVGAGGSSAIEIQKDDVTVNANTDTLNFTGPAITEITDEGGGKTTVKVIGAAINGIVGGDKYVPRGDPQNWDWTSLTTDGNWHELDLSDILPPEAAGKLIHFSAQLLVNNSGAGMYLRKKGKTGSLDGRAVCTSANIVTNFSDIWVQCDENRKVEYWFTGGVTWSRTYLVIRGWYKDELVDSEIIGENYINRGDPSAVDFSISDIITDGAWHDLDLSGILPPEAAGQLIHLLVKIRHQYAGISAFFRENGNTNVVNVAGITSQEANGVNYQDIWIKCDENRIIEYLTSSTGTWYDFNITVRGWMRPVVGGSRNAIAGGVKFVDRGDPSAYDWTLTDFVRDGNWHDLDASSILPSSAANQRVLIRASIASSSINDYLQIRQKGNSNVYNAAYLRGTSGAGDYLVPCDINRKFEYRVNEAGSISSLAVVIRGWEEEATIDTMVRGDTYIDRGDPSSWDFTLSDFTADDNVHDLDLSDILPPEAAGQLVHLKAEVRKTISGGATFKIQEPNRSNIFNSLWVKSNLVNANEVAEGWVRCDENRRVQYVLSSGASWSYVNLLVRGWMKTSDGGAVAGVKYIDRGEVSGWDFDVSAFTRDNNWHELDLSSILPLEAAGQLVHLRVQCTDNTQGTSVFLAHPDSDNGWNIAAIYNNVTSKAHSHDIHIRCNKNRKIVYKISSDFDYVNLIVRRWFQPIDKGQ
ncbi:hypothetical protein DRH14_03915, partial [Candidatus Shapirobacteria bacterium]